MNARRVRVGVCLCVLVVVGATSSPTAQPPGSGQNARARRMRDEAPPASPGDDRRMSAMGRLAWRAASGKLKLKRPAGDESRTAGERIDVTPEEPEGEGPAGGQAETSIAVDGTGQHIVIGSNDSRGFSLNPLSVSGFAYSDDGGATFTDGGQLPVTTGTSTIGSTVYPQVFGDPEVKYLGGTTFVYFSIVVKKINSTGTAQTMGVHRSTDNGHTWQGPFEILPATNPNNLVFAGNPRNAVDAADKEFADVDPDTGRVILTWTNFTLTSIAPAGAEISSTFSDNIATATPPTWSARVVVGATASDGQASIPRFAGNGSPNAYVAWRRFPGGSGQNVGFARSTNNGLTFSAPINLTADFFTMDQVLGNDRNNTSPSLAVDTSPGAFHGNIYVVYSNNDNHDGADVVFQRSVNEGASFSAPVSVNSRPGTDRPQWFPWVNVDKNTGRVYVFYYDQAIANDGDLTETTYQYSDDGGVTWSRPAPLTSRPFHAGYGNDTGQPNLGDYNQAIAQNGELFAVWAESPPLVGFADGQPTSTNMTVPDTVVKRLPESSTRVAIALGQVVASDAGGGPLSGNGFIDPGEQVALTIPLKNYVTNAINATMISGINATLTTTTPGVVVTQGSSAYTNLAAGATTSNSSPFVFTTGSAFVPGTRVELTLNVTTAQGSTTLPFTQATGTPFATTLLSENFNGVAAGALPAGWTTLHAGGTNTVPWTTSNLSLGAAPAAISNAAFHANANDGGVNANTRFERLFSPQFTVPANAEYVTVDFDAAYDTEDEPAFNVQTYDGFLLRIFDATSGRVARSVQVESFAEEFTTGTANFYPKHMPRNDNTSYLQDLSAWGGDSVGYKHVHLKLPGMAGSTAQLRFEYTQDSIGICSDIRPGHRCGVLVDNVVVRSVQSVAPSSTMLSSSANPSLFGQPVTFTATVTTSSGAFATSGSVTFKEGSTVLAGPLALAGGQAQFTTAGLSLGLHTITAQYTPSDPLLSESSATLVQHVVVGVSIGDVTVTEGNSGFVSASFTVSLSQSSPETVTANWTTSDGTATVADNDYLAAAGSVTFAPGETSKPVVVSVAGDTKFEPDETFFVLMTGASNALFIDAQATGTILNDDASGPNEQTVNQTIANGGARLKALQNPDGGWSFKVGSAACGGTYGTCPNTFGITALGLLVSYARTNDATLLSAATAAGDELVARYNVAASQTPPGLPFSQDIEFLVALAQASGNATYSTTAQSWFQLAVNRFPIAGDRIDDMLARRNAQTLRTNVAWDAASLIRAAKAVSNVTYAQAAANYIRDLEPIWKDTDPSHRFDQCPNPAGCGPSDNPLAFDYTILGEGSLLWAIHDLPGFDAQIVEYRSFLLAQQDAAGSWDVGDSQITAYVVLGLAAVGGAGADAAINAASGFFIANQLAAGGWPSFVSAGGNGSEYGEVDGEVVRAMGTLFSTGQGFNVSVAPAQLSRVTFSSVTTSGLTTVVAVDPSTVPQVDSGFELVNRLTYQVSTTASISGGTTVCFSVPWVNDRATFAHLRILHAEDGALVDRTSVSPRESDFSARRVCARVSSLSSFAVALRRPGSQGRPPP